MILLDARSSSDSELFSCARREELSLYTDYLRPNHIRIRLARSPLAHATVRVQLVRAAKKLGASTREGLLSRFAATLDIDRES